jgi:hypothetical protein
MRKSAMQWRRSDWTIIFKVISYFLNEVNMKFANIFQKISKWALTTTSVFTMVMFPVTQGQAAQNETTKISKAQVQSAIAQLGLNKSMTLGDFYKKNKDLYPARLQSQLESFIKDNADYVMPTFDVTSVKNSAGQDIPTVRLSKDAELVNIQIYGDSEKYVKFNNTNLTEIDIINFKDMFLKLNNGDANLRKQLERSESTTANKFKGFSAVTKEVWSGMSARDKAEYILNMRQLWSDAQKVLILNDKKLNRKTSQFEYFWNQIFQESEAAPIKKIVAIKPKPPAAAVSVVRADSGTTVEANSENCLVAGYVSSYAKGSCGVSALQDAYKDEKGAVNPVISKAQAQCGSGQIACNPFVYGLPSGKAICLTVKDPKFQIATHANGPCDMASPLGTTVDFLNKDLKNKDRYSAENLKSNPEQLAAEYKKQQASNSAYVENYLNGFLPAGIDFSKEIDGKILEQIVNIKSAFDNDISKAKESCMAAAANKYNEKNFWGACDQLQRRFLFVAEFLKEKPGCKDGSTMDPGTLKCLCPDKSTEVNPGAKCPIVTDVKPTPVKPGEPTVITSSDSSKPEPCKEFAVNENGAKVCIDKPAVDKAPKKDGGWFGSIGGFFKKALPWLIGGAVVFAMYKLWSPKKPKLNSAGDSCPNGSVPPCGQVCTAPLSNVNGICVCASCPPGQSLTNAATCTCSTTTTGGTTTVTCPDGTTQAATLALCPATQYTCWDGSRVPNPINCPEKPPTVSPKITPSKK